MCLKVEELCGCAVKEEQIEMKLGAVVAQWGSTVFTFGDFKSHGPVLLKVCLGCMHAVQSTAALAAGLHSELCLGVFDRADCDLPCSAIAGHV